MREKDVEKKPKADELASMAGSLMTRIRLSPPFGASPAASSKLSEKVVFPGCVTLPVFAPVLYDEVCTPLKLRVTISQN
jgi:hypothetical protein